MTRKFYDLTAKGREYEKDGLRKWAVNAASDSEGLSRLGIPQETAE
jgi:hypothetical protein